LQLFKVLLLLGGGAQDHWGLAGLEGRALARSALVNLSLWAAALPFELPQFKLCDLKIQRVKSTFSSAAELFFSLLPGVVAVNVEAE